MRLSLQFSLVLLAVGAFGTPLLLRAASRIVEARLEPAPEGGAGWVLRTGRDAAPAVVTKKTRFWAHQAAADAAAFGPGDAVVARIADGSPATIRELADRESWAWLEGIRNEPRDGYVKSFDGKLLTIAFADGSEMAYRTTPKSEVFLGGRPAALEDLKPGQPLWLKGRTLSTLDVGLVAASDRAFASPPKGTKSARRDDGAAKPPRLSASGLLKGRIDDRYPASRMFDLIVGGYRLHVAYVADTAFSLAGAKCGPEELARGREAAVRYRRDASGRIAATRVEIR